VIRSVAGELAALAALDAWTPPDLNLLGRVLAGLRRMDLGHADAQPRIPGLGIVPSEN
jgi:hypothetical protein